MTTIAKFESLADYASRLTLNAYEGLKHGWLLVNCDDVELGQVAYCFYYCVTEQVERWVSNEQIKIYKMLANVPGDEWVVVGFEGMARRKAER
ncbi:hypothetical protein [Nodularia sphaerocarpa]|uniref:hypothetical protein n=1 Tax=Nodularia sphaerocarpa TaxID=137816 RepID=UPI00232D41C7|nr:hypothetical protein [Nodularia sphaerocarpa]MDB9372352.1 hypothetical protein [Nodularia sphaerocarpa CS-585]MDB9377968.1 hypothetical protein [Nodularia sphaerocarpa CS-585A2]